MGKKGKVYENPFCQYLLWPRKYLNLKYFKILIFRKLATSHFEPTYARRAFPCFDEPHLKAKFLMTITHDRNLVAFFNTPKKGVSSEVRGRPTQVNSSIANLRRRTELPL